MMFLKKILKIYYEPYSYIHSSYLHQDFFLNEKWSDILINHWIIENYKLENDINHNCFDEILIYNTIMNWGKLPDIASLIGGYLLRHTFVNRTDELLTDKRTLDFISLPLVHHTSVTEQCDHTDSTAWGIAFLLSLNNGISHGFKQRLLLVFPETVNLPSLQVSKTPCHINLFKMAILYANNFH